MQNTPPLPQKNQNTWAHLPLRYIRQNESCELAAEFESTPRWISLFSFVFLLAFIPLLKLKSPQKRNKICEQRNSGVPQGCDRLNKKEAVSFWLVNFLGGSRAAEMSTVCQQMFVYGGFDTFSEAQRHRIRESVALLPFLGEKKNYSFFFFLTHFWPYMGAQNARAYEYEMLNAPGTQNTKGTLLSINY